MHYHQLLMEYIQILDGIRRGELPSQELVIFFTNNITLYTKVFTNIYEVSYSEEDAKLNESIFHEESNLIEKYPFWANTLDKRNISLEQVINGAKRGKKEYTLFEKSRNQLIDNDSLRQTFTIFKVHSYLLYKENSISLDDLMGITEILSDKEINRYVNFFGNNDLIWNQIIYDNASLNIFEEDTKLLNKLGILTLDDLIMSYVLQPSKQLEKLILSSKLPYTHINDDLMVTYKVNGKLSENINNLIEDNLFNGQYNDSISEEIKPLLNNMEYSSQESLLLNQLDGILTNKLPITSQLEGSLDSIEDWKISHYLGRKRNNIKNDLYGDLKERDLEKSYLLVDNYIKTNGLTHTNKQDEDKYFIKTVDTNVKLQPFTKDTDTDIKVYTNKVALNKLKRKNIITLKQYLDSYLKDEDVLIQATLDIFKPLLLNLRSMEQLSTHFLGGDLQVFVLLNSDIPYIIEELIISYNLLSTTLSESSLFTSNIGILLGKQMYSIYHKELITKKIQNKKTDKVGMYKIEEIEKVVEAYLKNLSYLKNKEDKLINRLIKEDFPTLDYTFEPINKTEDFFSNTDYFKQRKGKQRTFDGLNREEIETILKEQLENLLVILEICLKGNSYTDGVNFKVRKGYTSEKLNRERQFVDENNILFKDRWVKDLQKINVANRKIIDTIYLTK